MMPRAPISVLALGLPAAATGAAIGSGPEVGSVETTVGRAAGTGAVVGADVGRTVGAGGLSLMTGRAGGVRSGTVADEGVTAGEVPTLPGGGTEGGLAGTGEVGGTTGATGGGTTTGTCLGSEDETDLGLATAVDRTPADSSVAVGLSAGLDRRLADQTPRAFSSTGKSATGTTLAFGLVRQAPSATAPASSREKQPRCMTDAVIGRESAWRSRAAGRLERQTAPP